MKLEKEIESIIRAIFYPKSQILLICDSKENSNQCLNDFKVLSNQHQILQKEIEDMNDTKIIFKNGSSIEVITPNKSEENIRGKRAKIYPYSFDWEYAAIDKEIFEEVCKPYLNNR